MSNIIDSIQVSGVTYTIQGSGGGGNPTVELTQAEYDALVTAGTVSQNTYYIITDATAGDLTQYWTSAQTQSAITSAVSTKQDQLVSGTNIKTINNESILGSGNIDIQGGGGKAIEAGRGISITTGQTADTVSFNLPISAGTGSNSIICNRSDNKASGSYSFAGGQASSATSFWSFAYGANCKSGYGAWAGGYQCQANGDYSFAIGERAKTSNGSECSIGHYNVTNTGSTNDLKTLFSVGNGTADNARHNAFEIRQNGDIYISSGGTDIKLQDNLGGGGSSYSAGTGIDITNNVISVTGKVDTSTYETYTAATATAIGNKLATSDFNTYSGAVDTAINSKASESDLSGLTDVVSAHTANTTIHVTTAQTASWDAKSNFSGSYNDLTDKPTIPTVPTSNTAFTNDAGYITSDAISGKADTSAVTESINAAVSGKVDTSAITTSVTSSSTDAQVPSAKAVNDKLGGLSLVKLTQAAYDNLSTYDSNTLYVIVN